MASPDPPPRPRGRQEVREALLTAAERLMAERGASNVPLRDIADAAGVNFGLLYQYVGTREDLLREVYQRVARGSAERFEELDHLSDAIDLLMNMPAGRNNVGRMMGWTALEGAYPADVFGPSPALEQVAALMRREAAANGHEMPDDEARLLAAFLLVTSLGWRLFRPIGLTSAGLDAGEDHVGRDKQITEWLQQLTQLVIRGPHGGA